MSDELLWCWEDNDVLELLSRWKKWNKLLSELKEKDSDRVLELRRNWKTPREIQKILDAESNI